MYDHRIVAPLGVHTDERGSIVSLPAFPTVASTVIESRAGAVRGNHYHRDESHLMYVISGLMLYLEEDGSGSLAAFEVGPGESVVSPPGAPHATVFLEDTIFVALSDVDRSGHRYEGGVVRVRPLQERPEISDRISAAGKLITVHYPLLEGRP